MIIKQKQNWLRGISYNLQMIIFASSLCSIFSYLLVVNHTNTMGIEIGERQYQIKQLEEEYRDLQTQATMLQSMSRIEEISNQQLSMVKAENFDYVKPAEAAVAAKN